MNDWSAAQIIAFLVMLFLPQIITTRSALMCMRRNSERQYRDLVRMFRRMLEEEAQILDREADGGGPMK